VQIDLCVLGHPVRVTTQDETVGKAIALFWQPAISHAPSTPEIRKRRFDYVFEADRLYFRGEIVARAERESELLAGFERHLLDTLVDAGRETCLLHAGAACLDGVLYVFVGPSGAGKSTFMRYLVLRGAAYLSDDLLALGGDTLDGAARSIQFDALTDSTVPAHFADCALVDYPAGGFPLGALRVPVVRANYRGRGPVQLSGLRVVLLRLRRGAQNELSTLPALERLSCLHAATLVGGRSYSGGLDHGLAFDLTWSEPERALESLLASVG